MNISGLHMLMTDALTSKKVQKGHKAQTEGHKTQTEGHKTQTEGRKTLKEVCRALDLWPCVIADLVAEYAYHTVAEKTAILMGEFERGRDIIEGVSMKFVWWTLRDDIGIRIAYQHLDPCRNDGLWLMTRHNFIQSVVGRRWIADDGEHPMDSADMAMLDKWLAQIE